MIVYVVHREVDLGSHVQSIWTTREQADEEKNKLKEAYSKYNPCYNGTCYFVEEIELNTPFTGWPL